MQTRSADFRDAAVAASEQRLATIEAERGREFPDPALAGISYCLPAGGDASSVVKTLRLIIAARLILCVITLPGLLLIVNLYAMSDSKPTLDAQTVWLLALAYVVCSFGLILSSFGATRSLIARHIRGRMAAAGLAPLDRALSAELEEPGRIWSFGMMADDRGYIVFHKQERRVQIEGLTHRYMIRAEDVVKVIDSGRSRRDWIRVRYTVANGELTLILRPDNLTAALGKASRYSPPHPIHRRLAECLLPAKGE
ncbi:MAG: hypothetical protein NTW19_21935 [Planctomycetota bacterium]|nr:hypothetical protein [Planctomycetota bacterium]